MKYLNLPELQGKYRVLILSTSSQEAFMPRQTVKILDYRIKSASNEFLPQPAILSSSRWDGIHLEMHRQPAFECSRHHHTMHVIAWDVSNSPAPGERWLDGKVKSERRNQGDIAIIPAGIVHRCNWNTSAEFGILAFEPELLQQVGRDLVDYDSIELVPRFMDDQDTLIGGILSTLKDELELSQIGSNLLIDSLKTTLAIHLLRKYTTKKAKLSSYQNGLSQSKIRQIIDYIRAHLDRDLKIVELASLVQMSPYYFIRLFKESTGKTPHQYILLSRIEKAKYLLKQNRLSIAAIATLVGFCDQSHFSRYFKRLVGVTPKQFIDKSQ